MIGNGEWSGAVVLRASAARVRRNHEPMIERHRPDPNRAERERETGHAHRPVNAALPGPFSRKLFTPIWLSSVRKTSTKISVSRFSPSAS